LKTDPQNDQEVWHAFRAGDREAFATLFNQHYRHLYSYGRQFLDDETLTEDAIHDLFITLWRTREKLTEEIDSIKFYLFRCLRRNIRRLSDREKRLQNFDIQPEVHGIGRQFETPDFVEGNDESLLIQRLKAIIAQLPPRQREVVMLRYYENFKADEIALLLGISEKTVRNTLFNAMTTLRSSSALLKASLALAALYFLLSI
jgi:RNA polymerase sigma factor (sigma-70 family)